MSSAGRHVVWVLVICVLGPMYFVGQREFSYALFPYIPATRDGGDYTVSPVVNIHLKNGLVLHGLRLLEETSSDVYVADEKEDPENWRDNPDSTPKVRAISRDQVGEIDYAHGTVENDNDSEPPCPQAEATPRAGSGTAGRANARAAKASQRSADK